MRAFIFLYIMGLKISLATGQGMSTQVYYANLTIEKSALENITGLLTNFKIVSDMTIDKLTKTTKCENVSNITECSCESGYRWSDKVRQSSEKNCRTDKCTFPQGSAHMCVSNTTVTIKGSFTLRGFSYYNCLSEEQTQEFKDCNNNLTEKIKKVYSTFVGFSVFKMTRYSPGSVIADFEMTVIYNINPQDLLKKSSDLCKTLSASLRLETTGIVSLKMPPNPVRYHSQATLNCSSAENLGGPPEVYLRRQEGEVNITNGTELKLTSGPRFTNLIIKDTTEVWRGNYTCSFRQGQSSAIIIHKASAMLEVALLPTIHTNVLPQFPSCKDKDIVKVDIKCEIDKKSEAYNVTWTSSDTALRIIENRRNDFPEGTLVYAAKVVVSCSTGEPRGNPQVVCQFQNTLGQTRNASVNIIIIYAGDQYCAAQGDWKMAKAGYTAVLKCKNEDGQRRRKCNKRTKPATWEEEVSNCVNPEVNSLLQSANRVDSGLGSVEENTVAVFSSLLNVTNNTEKINSVASMNASVYVLSTLSQKLNQKLNPITNDSAADNFLESSSNLLQKSLEKSWEGQAEGSNLSLAEIYMSSVERLISMTNLTRINKKPNLEVSTCKSEPGSKCNNSVFNVSVSLESQNPTNVKTTGFKQLEKYLPNKDKKYIPNSIVVSTTIDSDHSDPVVVHIDFPLLKMRDKNVEMKCVSWDNTTRKWSKEGCKWIPDSNNGHCECTHLSSFAILMSLHPLEVPGLTVLSLVGLSVSVISLIISIAIEVTVWRAVVKTNALYLRHTAHINISLCLLVADCCFLASSYPNKLPEIWCKTFVVLKHFCYLSMFFWTLCLSTTLLHQAVFLFHSVSKKTYLRLSLTVGYACPLIIVASAFIANHGGAKDWYFSTKTCWLVYEAPLRSSFFSFLIPVSIIVFINIFSMLVVIMKLVDHPGNTDTSLGREKTAAKTAMRSVILLTPIFGTTWILGFGVMLLDLTAGFMAYAVNYAFTLLNTFQGLFILLTTCLGDKLTREALLKRLGKNAPAVMSQSSTTLSSRGKR